MKKDTLEGIVTLGFFATAGLILLGQYFIPVLRAKEKVNQAIRKRYELNKQNLVRELGRLEFERLGSSVYASPEYFQLVLEEHSTALREALSGSIPPGDARVLGEEFLRGYKETAERVIGLMRRHQPSFCLYICILALILSLDAGNRK